MGAGEALQSAAIAALKTIGGLGVYEGPPVQAAFPYAVVESGPESDWSHKTGEGREVRLAVVLWDQGERPVRLRALIEQCEQALAAIGAELDSWRLVTIRFLRSRLIQEPRKTSPVWMATIEYRALLERT